MAGAVKIPMHCRNSDEFVKCSGQPESLALLFFGFLEEGNMSPESLCNYEERYDYRDMNNIDFDDESKDANAANYVNGVEEDKSFWESKDKLLQATLRKKSSTESKIKHAIKEAMTESKLAGNGCSCGKSPTVADECQNCLQKQISDYLQRVGYNCVICKSRWRSSADIPSGEHTFLEVVDNSSSKKGEVRIVIELNFRAEFVMARANEEYNKLIGQLPDLFVAKAEKLQAVIKTLCSSAKKCMKDRNMHMGPWRKKKNMLAKWFGTCERTITAAPIRSEGFSDKLPKPRASMLTLDLIDNFQVMHCTAVN